MSLKFLILNEKLKYIKKSIKYDDDLIYFDIIDLY